MAPPIKRPTPRLAKDQIDLSTAQAPYTEIEVISSAGDFTPGLATTGKKFSLRIQDSVNSKAKTVEVDEVPPEALALNNKRFFYLFVDSAIVSANLQDAADPDFQSQVHTGRPFDNLADTPFVLTGLHFITQAGLYEEAFASDVRQAATAGTAPPTSPANPTANVVLFTTSQSFIIGTGAPFKTETIDGFEKDGCPKPFPIFNADSVFPIVARTPQSFSFVFPSIDPVVMTQALTKKYHAACDLYLAHAQDFSQPPVARKTDPQVATGYRNYLKNSLAHAFLQLLKVVPSLRSAVGQGGQAHKNFIQTYKDGIDKLRTDRESAAKDLVAWLLSDFMEVVELWYRSKDALDQVTISGQQELTITEYVQAVSFACSRLVETQAGVDCALSLINDAKGTAPAKGVARVIDEFILADKNFGADWTKVSTTASTGIVNAWATFAGIVAMKTANGEALDFIRARSSTGQAALNDAIEVLVRFPNNVFNKPLIELRKLREAELDGPLDEFAARLKARLDQPLRIGGLADTMQQFAPGKQPTAGSLSPQGLTLTLGAVNAVIKVSGLVEEAKKATPGAALNDATLAALEGLVTLADEIGKLTLAKTAANTAFSHSLGLVAAGLSLLAAEEGARDKWENHDWDAMAAKVVEGVGAGATAFGIYLMATAPATGPTPAAGFLFFAGAILGVGGAVWGLFAADVPYEQLLKFSVFGSDPSASVKAPLWALADTFAEWNETEEGLKLQLRAAEQLFHGFMVEGIIPPGASAAADGAFRITPASVIRGSTFHINYTVQYKPFGGTPQGPVTGYVRIDIESGTNPSTFVGKMTNDAQTFETANAVTIGSVGGQTVVDIRLKKRPPVVDEKGNPMELENLTCRVRLDVNGNGSSAAQGADATLVVPNSKNGARFVDCLAVAGARVNGKQVKSYEVT